MIGPGSDKKGRQNSGAARSLAQNLNLALRRSLCDTPTPIQSMIYKTITIMNFKWNWTLSVDISFIQNISIAANPAKSWPIFSFFLLNIPLTIKLPQDFQAMLSWFELNFTVTIAFVRIFLRAHAAYAMFLGVIPHQINQIISKNKCSLIFIGTDTCKFLWNTFNVYISMCSDSVYICHVSINYLL